MIGEAVGVSEWESLPAEQLLGLLHVQAEQITVLTAQVEELTAQVVQLNRRLGRNSSNSSLPPSSDRGDAPAKPARRGRTGS